MIENYHKLATDIITSFGGTLVISEIHNKVALNINSYLTSNLTLKGTYVGVTGSGSPDPLNGSVEYKLASIPLVGTNLELSAPGGLPSYLNSIVSSLKLSLFNLVSSSLVTITPPNPILVALDTSLTLSSEGFSDVASGMESYYLDQSSNSNLPSQKSLLSSIDSSITPEDLDLLTPAFIGQQFLYKILLKSIESTVVSPSPAVTAGGTGSVTFNSIEIL